METEFRRRVNLHVRSLPTSDSSLAKFNTNPFVLMIHCMQRGYSRISQIENDILPAKQFSSMETSAGRMIEAVALPAYGWEVVTSGMHSPNSALDGKKLSEITLCAATLKSGPRCLNDEMSENFADSILAHSGAWAQEAGVSKIDFTYGVLYGTQKMSNKKDWHILRNIAEKAPQGSITEPPTNRWSCSLTHNGVEVSATIRIGLDWWEYLGGPRCLVELCTSLIRACVRPGDPDSLEHEYTITDLRQITSLATVPQEFNVAILQREQLSWLFFLARHFCDILTED